MMLIRESSRSEGTGKIHFKDRLPFHRLQECLNWLLFSLMLLVIPMTSSPLIARFTGMSTVSPLSGVPLFLLVLLWFLPYLLRNGKLSVISTPLLIFFMLALITSILAPFREIQPILGESLLGRDLRGLLTLGVGVGFYFVVATFPRTEIGLRRSLRWIYLGGVLTLIWASIQAYLIYRTGGMPHEFQNIHRIFSIHDTPGYRVSGLEYESSWLGDQLVILYLPLWLSSVLGGYSVFGNKSKRFSFELVLLLWGVLILILAESRISLLSAFAVAGVLVLVAGWRKTGQWAKKIIVKKRKSDRDISNRRRILLQISLWLVLLLLMIMVVFAILKVVSLIDWRIERIFQLDYLDVLKSSSTPIYALSERLAYAERVVYWDSGIHVFSNYPLFGVGIGNSGFFFRKYASAYGYHLPEIIRILTGEPQFPNTKSLWVRLLAETGLIGFLIFVAWLIMLAFGAWRLQKHAKGIMGLIGLAGLMALLAQWIEGFSLDTFALPHLWVMLALVTAALSISTSEKIPVEDRTSIK